MFAYVYQDSHYKMPIEYTENSKTLMKEIEEDTNKWKDIPCSWIERVNIVKNFHTTQSNLQIQCNPYQNSNNTFHRNTTNNLKVCMDPQKTTLAKAILRK